MNHQALLFVAVLVLSFVHKSTLGEAKCSSVNATGSVYVAPTGVIVIGDFAGVPGATHYKASENCSWEIVCPSEAMPTIRSLKMAIERRYDNLRLNGVVARQDSRGAVFLPGRSLTVNFTSDKSVQLEGFLLEWECVVPTRAPTPTTPGRWPLSFPPRCGSALGRRFSANTSATTVTITRGGVPTLLRSNDSTAAFPDTSSALATTISYSDDGAASVNDSVVVLFSCCSSANVSGSVYRDLEGVLTIGTYAGGGSKGYNPQEGCSWDIQCPDDYLPSVQQWILDTDGYGYNIAHLNGIDARDGYGTANRRLYFLPSPVLKVNFTSSLTPVGNGFFMSWKCIAPSQQFARWPVDVSRCAAATAQLRRSYKVPNPIGVSVGVSVGGTSAFFNTSHSRGTVDTADPTVPAYLSYSVARYATPRPVMLAITCACSSPNRSSTVYTGNEGQLVVGNYSGTGDRKYNREESCTWTIVCPPTHMVTIPQLLGSVGVYGATLHLAGLEARGIFSDGQLVQRQFYALPNNSLSIRFSSSFSWDAFGFALNWKCAPPIVAPTATTPGQWPLPIHYTPTCPVAQVRRQFQYFDNVSLSIHSDGETVPLDAEGEPLLFNLNASATASPPTISYTMPAGQSPQNASTIMVTASCACSSPNATRSVFTALEGSIVIGNYSGTGQETYLANEACEWTVQCPANYMVAVRNLSVSLGYNYYRRKGDHLSLNGIQSVLMRTPSGLNQQFYFVPNASLKVNFTSDDRYQSLGFRLDWSCIAPSVAPTPTTSGEWPLLEAPCADRVATLKAMSGDTNTNWTSVELTASAKTTALDEESVVPFVALKRGAASIRFSRIADSTTSNRSETDMMVYTQCGCNSDNQTESVFTETKGTLSLRPYYPMVFCNWYVQCPKNSILAVDSVAAWDASLELNGENVTHYRWKGSGSQLYFTNASLSVKLSTGRHANTWTYFKLTWQCVAPSANGQGFPLLPTNQGWMCRTLQAHLSQPLATPAPAIELRSGGLRQPLGVQPSYINLEVPQDQSTLFWDPHSTGVPDAMVMTMCTCSSPNITGSVYTSSRGVLAVGNYSGGWGGSGGVRSYNSHENCTWTIQCPPNAILGVQHYQAQFLSFYSPLTVNDRTLPFWSYGLRRERMYLAPTGPAVVRFATGSYRTPYYKGFRLEWECLSPTAATQPPRWSLLNETCNVVRAHVSHGSNLQVAITDDTVGAAPVILNHTETIVNVGANSTLSYALQNMSQSPTPTLIRTSCACSSPNRTNSVFSALRGMIAVGTYATPGASYERYELCGWRIQCPQHHIVGIRHFFSNVERHSDPILLNGNSAPWQTGSMNDTHTSTNMYLLPNSSLTVNFTSDGSVQKDGFLLVWQCIAPVTIATHSSSSPSSGSTFRRRWPLLSQKCASMTAKVALSTWHLPSVEVDLEINGLGRSINASGPWTGLTPNAGVSLPSTISYQLPNGTSADAEAGKDIAYSMVTVECERSISPQPSPSRGTGAGAASVAVPVVMGVVLCGGVAAAVAFFVLRKSKKWRKSIVNDHDYLENSNPAAYGATNIQGSV